MLHSSDPASCLSAPALRSSDPALRSSDPASRSSDPVPTKVWTSRLRSTSTSPAPSVRDTQLSTDALSSIPESSSYHGRDWGTRREKTDDSYAVNRYKAIQGTTSGDTSRLANNLFADPSLPNERNEHVRFKHLPSGLAIPGRLSINDKSSFPNLLSRGSGQDKQKTLVYVDSHPSPNVLKAPLAQNESAAISSTPTSKCSNSSARSTTSVSTPRSTNSTSSSPRPSTSPTTTTVAPSSNICRRPLDVPLGEIETNKSSFHGKRSKIEPKRVTFADSVLSDSESMESGNSMSNTNSRRNSLHSTNSSKRLKTYLD